jgi:hypothetical protein
MRADVIGDIQLLKLAAKAASIELNEWSDDHNAFGLKSTAIRGTTEWWNPLTKDGDALRLAVKLQLTVCNDHINSGTAYCTDYTQDHSFPSVFSGTDEGEVIDDDYAATRRAIVLAAAEICANDFSYLDAN